MSALSPSSCSEPTLITKSNDIWGDSNFPQGCQISPDGLCVLTSTTADNLLRLYNVPHPNNSSQNQTDATSNNATADANVDANDDANSVSNTPPAVSSSHNQSSQMTASSPLLQPSSWKTSLSAREGDSVRSYCWFPLMNSYHPPSCAFLACSREQPIHLVDAYTSQIRASYRPYNALDELESPNVITFTPDGSRIFSSGFRTDRMIQVFDTAIPGRDATILRLGKTRRSKDGQKGICSALSFPSTTNNIFGSTKSSVFTVGTYSPGSIYIYDDRRPSGDPAGTVLHGGMCIVGHGKGFTRKKRRFVDISVNKNERDMNDVTNVDVNMSDEEENIFSMAKVNWYQSRARGGITQLQWSTGSDFFLYSASRRSDAVLAWDMRVLTGSESHPIRGIMSFPRESDTNQRLEFDLSEDGTKMYTASQDKTVKIFDARKGTLIKTLGVFDDVVNGVSIKKDFNGKEILAVASGSRRFDELNDDEEDDDDVVVSGKTQYSSNDEKTSELVVPGALSLFEL